MDEDLRILVKVLPSVVEWQKVERGIAVRPVNQPAVESIVEMPADVRDRVWDWLHNPRVVEDTEDWKALRKLIMSVLLEIAKIIMQYGQPMHREILRKAINMLEDRIVFDSVEKL
jgi:hypothetical protein